MTARRRIASVAGAVVAFLALRSFVFPSTAPAWRSTPARAPATELGLDLLDTLRTSTTTYMFDAYTGGSCRRRAVSAWPVEGQLLGAGSLM